MMPFFRFVGCFCILGLISFAQETSNATPVSLIELLASPEKYDGKAVTVRGFLTIGQEPRHGVEAFLHLQEEDARHQLGNEILVVASEKMIRDKEKINMVYVILTGTVRATQAANGWWAAQITNVQNCVLWSNPARPIGDDSRKPK